MTRRGRETDERRLAEEEFIAKERLCDGTIPLYVTST
jgi:hypothetical protein